MLNKLINKIAKYMAVPMRREYDLLRQEIEQNRILLGRHYSLALRTSNLSKLSDAEFKVFSQCGEDGIIQYLISQIPIPNETFIEFGVEDYQESNTRYLLMNNNWTGLVMDGNAQSIERIRSKPYFWQHDLTAKHAFITAENINSLIQESGIHGDIGLLSIDIDGNDYWIWEAINPDVISPRIVIVEYNSVFGKHHAITIPYNQNFQRTKAHYSNLYFGASLKALCLLAERKGYAFIGSNNAGSNAFFVRRDVLGSLKPVDPIIGHVDSRFRQARDTTGQLSFVSGEKRLQLIAEQVVQNTETGETKRIREIFQDDTR